MARNNGEIVRRYFDEWANHANSNTADELIAPDVTLRHPHITLNGLEAYKQSMLGFHNVFPDVHFLVEDLVAQDDKVLVRWLMTGTQRGEFMGRPPAAGKAIKVTGMSLFRIEAGKIREIWVNSDRYGMLEQLGIIQTPAVASTPTDSYFELRIYSVSANKMDAVLERFRDTVEPVRQKHGIRTAGYWTSQGKTNGGVFVYLLAATNREELQQREQAFVADPQFQEGYAANSQKYGKTVDGIVSLPLTIVPAAGLDFTASSMPRTFELRIYSILPGRLEAFTSRWQNHAAPIYERHGLHSIGWWVAGSKDADGHDRFVCLLAGAGGEAIQKSMTAFHADPEWQRIERASEQDGKLHSGVTAFQLTPADFSKLQ